MHGENLKLTCSPI